MNQIMNEKPNPSKESKLELTPSNSNFTSTNNTSSNTPTNNSPNKPLKEEKERKEQEEEEKKKKEEEIKKKEEEKKIKEEIHNGEQPSMFVGDIVLRPQSSKRVLSIKHLIELRKYTSNHNMIVKYNFKGCLKPVLVTIGDNWKPHFKKDKNFENFDRDQEVIKEFRDLLNKITNETFDMICEKILSNKTSINNVVILRSIVKVIFDKAIIEKFFCPLYVKLCEILSNKFPTLTYTDEDGTQKQETFKRILLNTCQNEFERETKGPPEKLTPLEEEEWKINSKRRMLGKK